MIPVYLNYNSSIKREQRKNDQIMVLILRFSLQLYIISLVFSETLKFTSSYVYSAFVLNKHSVIKTPYTTSTSSKIFSSCTHRTTKWIKTNKKRTIHECINDSSSSSIPVLKDDLKKSTRNPFFPSKTKNQRIISINDKINKHQTSRLDLNLLLIDNFDSYTYNLYQYFAEICYNPPIVITNDEFDKYKSIQEQTVLDGIIISPGPGNPINPIDVGVCKKAILENPTLPILGVCLGHQLMGHVYNASVHVAPTPMHGIICNMYHEDETFTNTWIKEKRKKRMNNNIIHDSYPMSNIHLFQDIPKQFNATRYHSLIVTIPSNNSDLIPIAWSQSHTSNSLHDNHSSDNDNIIVDKASWNKSNECIMALRHKNHPHWGVQFHPESVGTDPFGRTMIKNFCAIANQWKAYQNNSSKTTKLFREKDHNISIMRQEKIHLSSFTETTLNCKKETYEKQKIKFENENQHVAKFSVIVHHIEANAKYTQSNDYAQNIFESIYGEENCSFWLDSSSSSPSCPQKSRFSIMGANNGPYSNIIEYYGKIDHSSKQCGLYVDGKQMYDENNPNEKNNDTILNYLRNEMLKKRTDDVRMIQFANDTDNGIQLMKMKKDVEDLKIPFPYRGGYVGYLGYEVRHDTSPAPPQRDPLLNQQFVRKKANCNIPTAAFMFADRSIVVDHITGDVYIIGLVKQYEVDEVQLNSKASNPTFAWMEKITKQIHQISKSYFIPKNEIPGKYNGYGSKILSDNIERSISTSNISFQPSRSKATYKRDIAKCHVEIRKGESYELCLINQLKARVRTSQGKVSANHGKKGYHERNEFKRSSDLNPFGLYKTLRKRNPAPYAAFMKFDGRNKLVEGNDSADKMSAMDDVYGSVAICCSSPERFLSIRKKRNKYLQQLDHPSSSYENFEIESKPIKGTTPRIPVEKFKKQYKFEIESKPIKGTCSKENRKENISKNNIENENKNEKKIESITNDSNAQELQSSIKNRAENLMIVDLLRNDMNRICKVGSVHVPHLMEIESYATVHQLVSTIRGELMDGCNAVDALKACFPGGSMTGAPKVRTMQILDEDMEQRAVRGPYSGSLGYFSLNGCMDMNIIIRTAVLTPSTDLDENNQYNENFDDSLDISIGAGGAITALSESEDEYEEMLLKARAVVEAVNQWSENMGFEDGNNHESNQM